MKTREFYEEIVQDIIEERKDAPIDMLETGDAVGEYSYLENQKDAYVRTIKDIDTIFKTRDKSKKRVLEIGSFLGVTSIGLKDLGFDVHALDIPEFYKSSKLRSLYKRHDLPFKGLNLREGKLPYESDSFDVVLICEVIEHLNFNPLPVLLEINRVLKKGGIIYVAMPNQASILNRVKLLLGKSVHNSVDCFFQQLDKNENMIVGLHWREYTLVEACDLISRMGFEIRSKYYFSKKTGSGLKGLIMKVLFLISAFKPSLVVVGEKVSVPEYDFHLTEANS